MYVFFFFLLLLLLLFLLVSDCRYGVSPVNYPDPELTTVTVAKEFAVLLCEFLLFIRSQGKQNSCMGYYGIRGAFGGENFNTNQANSRRKGARN